MDTAFLCIGYHLMYVDKQTVSCLFAATYRGVDRKRGKGNGTIPETGRLLTYHDQLGSSAILGILEDANLSADQYNWLSSIFYLGYLVAEWPQNLALQRFPVAKMAGD